jgi:hypothetical protein
MDYEQWLTERDKRVAHEAIHVKPDDLHPVLFPHQRDLVSWALERGRAAIFADTGLGKTPMQVEWANHVSQHGRVLIIAPLAVSQQTIAEAQRLLGVEVVYDRTGQNDAPIVITNYEMSEHFDPSRFVGVVLDESSILKAYDGKTRTRLIRMFEETRFRLCCTATPAPNDHMELGNHSEFLGAKSRDEMLAEFFIHDMAKTQQWRLKGHARHSFWAWVGTWANVLKKPSDLGYDDNGFVLPPLLEEHVEIETDIADAHAAGQLFPVEATTLSDQRLMRRATMDKRIQSIADRVNGNERDLPALIWCEFNEESKRMTEAIPDAVEVAGSDTLDNKAERMLGFADGKYRVLVTKPKIAGFGMNWQHCNRVYFMGASHSFESTYQAIRRCWRFGQTHPVVVRTCVADREREVVKNYERKQRQAEEMAKHAARQFQIENRERGQRWNPYQPQKQMSHPTWLMS